MPRSRRPDNRCYSNPRDGRRFAGSTLVFGNSCTNTANAAAAVSALAGTGSALVAAVALATK